MTVLEFKAGTVRTQKWLKWSLVHQSNSMSAAVTNRTICFHFSLTSQLIAIAECVDSEKFSLKTSAIDCFLRHQTLSLSAHKKWCVFSSLFHHEKRMKMKTENELLEHKVDLTRKNRIIKMRNRQLLGSSPNVGRDDVYNDSLDAFMHLYRNRW